MLSTSVGMMTTYDKYALSSTAEHGIVNLDCESRGVHIGAMLTGPIAFQVTSEWQEVTKSLGPIGTLMDVASGFLQVTTGTTLWAPVLGRKLWNSTKPLSFTLKMEWVATSDAYAQVYQPAQGVMGLLHPRNTSPTGDVLTSYAIPGPGLFDSLAGVGKPVTPGGTVEVKDERGNTLINFKAAEADRVTITVGNFLRFYMCYLETANISFDNVFSVTGYPMHATAEVKCSCNDALFAKRDGTFMEEGVQEQAMALGGITSFLATLAKDLKQGSAKVLALGENLGGQLAM